MLVILSTLIGAFISIIIFLSAIILGGPSPCSIPGGEECIYLGGILQLLSIPLGFIITSITLIIGVIKQMRNPHYRLTAKGIKILLILIGITVIEAIVIKLNLLKWPVPF